MKRFSLGAVLILLFMLSGCKNINQRNGIPAEAVNNPGASFEATPSINGNKSIPSMQANSKNQRLKLDPTVVPTPGIIAGTPIKIGSNERVAVELQGIHDANEVVSVSISFRECDVEKIFKEQYPEIYDAYWLWKNSTDYEVGSEWPQEAYEKYGDRLESLVLQGSELANTISDKWYKEQEEAFWERHSELKERKKGGFHSIVLNISYSELEEILDDEGIIKIARVDSELYAPKIVGLYQGKNVYDISAFSARFFEGLRPKPGRVYSDVFGVDSIEEDGFLRVAVVMQEEYSDAGKAGEKKIDTAFVTLRDNGWPIVEEVDLGKNLPIPCGKSGRYITILLTKQQLKDLVVPDSTLYCFVCWEGYLRGAIEGLENGQIISEDD